MMNRMVFVLAISLWASILQARQADTIEYRLIYSRESKIVNISITSSDPVPSPLNLIIPRSAPGTYEITDYIQFVSSPIAVDSLNNKIIGERGIGSFYVFQSDHGIVSISYSVDLEKMENNLLEAFASSRARSGYLGLLGYSVFGFIEELQNMPIRLIIEIDRQWPVFSTLNPSEDLHSGRSIFRASSFDELADAQYLAGPDLQVWHSSSGPVPFFLTMYSESSKANKEEIGEIGLDMLIRLDEYFGFTPMPHYTMHLEYLVPVSENHTYGFWMEHMNSMTGFSDTSQVISKENYRPLGIIHHMAHSWIPLRCYGEGYRPFAWQVAPLIETIWLNEGFIWYIAGYKILGFEGLLTRFNRTVNNAPSFIKDLSLKDLSRLGSTQYSTDFRIGRNLYSRGALMAYELDFLIQSESGGTKSFKDAVLALYSWSRENNRAFKYEEIPTIISNGVEIDISPVWEKWNTKEYSHK